MSIFAEEEVPPIHAATLKPLEQTFKQEPVSLRLPISLPEPRREILVVTQPQTDYTPIILGLSFLAFLGFLAYLATRRRT